MTEEDVLQLWGELWLYTKGFSLTFDEEVEQDLKVYKEQFAYKDEEGEVI